jgi:hypothetical protein
MTTIARHITHALVVLTSLCLLALSASGQTVTYDPAAGVQLGPWVNANQGPGRVLVLPPGTYDLTSPIFLNAGTLRGTDPDVETRIRLKDRGLIWMAQASLPQDGPSRIGKTAAGRLALLTRPEGLKSASFDATETGLGKPMHAVRKLRVQMDLDCPTGDISPGGLFDLGPVAIWINDNPDWGRFVTPLLVLGTSSADPSPRRVETGLSWKKSTGVACSIMLDIDLDAGTGSVTINGDVLPISGIRPGDVLPACFNQRVTIGGMPTLPGSVARRGEWQASGPPADLRITRFEVTAGAVTHRMGLDGPSAPRVWSSDHGSVGLQPVLHDATTFAWQGGNPRLRNLQVFGSPGSNQAGVRIGQAMGSDCGIYDCSFETLGVGIRKLPGLVSYTHRFERLKFTYVGWPIVGQGMTIWARDWTARYPRFGVALLPDSNFTLRGIDVSSPSDCQYYFRIGGGSNGGNLTLADGMLNDEDGQVAAGAIFRHDGSVSSVARVVVEDLIFNVDPRRPALWLAKSAKPGRAFVRWVPWGAAIVEHGDGWTIEGLGVPAVPTAVTP